MTEAETSWQKSLRVVTGQVTKFIESVKECGGYTGELKWHTDKVTEMVEGLFARSPFKCGDRVELTTTPVITATHGWGWLGAKHFLVVGAVGVVGDVEFFHDQFYALVAFDDDSWLDHDGNRHAANEKSFYHFSERSLRRLPDNAEVDDG